MGAPIGNKFWKLRKDMSEDGRKISIEDLIIKVQDYVDRCYNEKLNEPDWVGKDAIEVTRPHMIAMTIYGLCHHLGISHVTWGEWKKDKKYSTICTRVEDLFKAYNVEGAAAGMLNHSIIARLEGITDKQDITSAGKKIGDTKTIVEFRDYSKK